MQTKPSEFSSAAFHITDDRVADQLAMDAKLVRPTGHRLELDKRRVGAAVADPKTRFRMLAVVLHAPMLEFGMPSDRRLDRAVVPLDEALDKSDIPFLDKLFHKVPRQDPVRSRSLCHDDKSGRIFVQPMDQAGPNEDGRRGLFIKMVGESIQKRSLLFTM